MHILVTGAAGFLGSHLSEQLVAQGHTVVGADNLITGSNRNLAGLQNHPAFSLINCDLTEPLPDAITRQTFQRIYHMASPASPTGYVRHQVVTLKVNALGTMHLLELAQRNQARILVASTSEAYGDPSEHPQRETYWGHVNPVGMRSMYDEAKRFMEAVTMAYHREQGVDTRIVRIFNTYGPRLAVNDGRVVVTFIAQALCNEPLTVQGDGSQTRSLCFVADEIRGLMALMECPNYHLPVNIGNPDEVTMLQLAKEIITLTGSTSRIRHTELPPDDPRQRCPDITLARKLLNWSPQVSRQEGLTRTIAYYRTLLANPG
jgi:dTDP-glucose 4,6-dehydratase